MLIGNNQVKGEPNERTNSTTCRWGWQGCMVYSKAGVAVMNKSFEALLRGYILFSVNGKRYMLYNCALKARKAIDGDVYFKGWHIIKGWLGFYQRDTMTVEESVLEVRETSTKARY